MADIPTLPLMRQAAVVADRAADPARPSAPDPEAIKLLAAQFESILLGQMLRDMRSSTFDDDPGTGFGSNPLSDALFTELTLAMSHAGGMGLAKALGGPLAREGAVAAPPEPTSAAGSPAIAAALGRVSSAYGWREDPISGERKFHKGTDIAMPEGSEVPAYRPGRVTFAGFRPGYGLTVEIGHDDRMTTRYAHLSVLLVQVGDQANAGQVVARSGSTGRVTGPHLHFEVLEAGQPVDPAHVLASYGQIP